MRAQGHGSDGHLNICGSVKKKPLLCGQLRVVLCAASALVSLTAKTELRRQRQSCWHDVLDGAENENFFGAENLPRKKLLTQYAGGGETPNFLAA